MMYNNECKPLGDKFEKTKKGVFLTLEGIDGSGKTTQIQRIIDFLHQADKEVVSLREPGGTVIGESIREILLDKKNTCMSSETELLLFAAARAQLVKQVIKPALERGAWVLCDRFMDSTVAYQGYGRNIELDMIDKLNRIAVGNCRPDITLLFDVEVPLAVKRLTSRCGKEDRLDLEDKSFMEKTRKGYLNLAKNEPERFRLIDASRSEEEIQYHIQCILREGTDL